MKSGGILLRGDKSTETIGAPGARRRLPLYLQLTFILAIALLLSSGGSWLASQINMQIFPHREAVLVLAVIAYILLMAIPFMPAIEVGLGLMLLMGSTGAVLAYLCTLTALTESPRIS